MVVPRPTNSQALNKIADQIRVLGRKMTADVLRIGEELLRAKHLAKHGGFAKWLEREFGWEERTAQRYMGIAEMQAKYKSAVDEWVATIRSEEALASVNHSVAEIDAWEHAAFLEDAARSKARAAKKAYEDALREEFFHF